MTALCDRALDLGDAGAAWALRTSGQCQPSHGQAADLQEMAPGVAIAIRRRFLAKDGKHCGALG